ncbi:MAG: energy transducer TonB [Bacteroidetes bacterium]|nr:energy transducer TonB [Bacteroidota bacterium]MBU1719277.1 energy transducer TonB [Bacteroidota bacterium]
MNHRFHIRRLTGVIVAFAIISSFHHAAGQTDSLPEVLKDMTFTRVDKFPEFPGGEAARIKFIENNIVYPAKAYRKKIQGEVIVSFIVNKDGSISDVYAEKGSLKKGCDKEAVRLVKSMPAWTPGKAMGCTVKVLLKMPINFSLQ